MIELKDIVVKFGDFEALHNINVNVKEGEFFTFLGPSGCGKTTTLRTITGFIEPVSGTVSVNEQDITHVPIEKRNIGIVFQSYALFPTMTVYDNIAFGLKLKKLKKPEIDQKVREIARKVDLSDEQLKKAVSQLSGGQQQRVAIARALVTGPSIICMDEPLSNLDAKLRVQLRNELKKMQREFGITTIYVTHDQEEALTMSDRVAVMSAGHILQLGTPEDIYNEPQSAFVADFIGDSDIMAGTMVRDKLVRFLGCDFPCVDTGFGENADVDVVLRPEDVKLKPADDPVQGVPQGIVESLLFKGVHYEMKVRVGDSVLLVHSTHARPVGTQVKLTVAPEDIQVMRKSDYSPDILKRHAARV